MMDKNLTRRGFLLGSLITLGGCSTLTRSAGPNILVKKSAGPVRVASIGCGGMGKNDVVGVERDGAVIAALCDVDARMGSEAFDWYPQVPHYTDFREMLDNETDIDAVMVSTPDHTHAPAALYAMAKGKHVYVQKPLTVTIYEARMLRAAARKHRVATQMGNQGHSADDVRALCEVIWAGVIGDIKEVHCWSDRPIWPQNLSGPWPAEPVPETLDWDLWLGTAQARPYNKAYCPFAWRAWWDFGTGALGDMGCHIIDPAFWALHLGAPQSVECLQKEGGNEMTAPAKSVIRYNFPERQWKDKTLPPVSLYWYDGGILPERPAGIGDAKLGDGANGSFFVGTKGVLTCGCYGGEPRLLPESEQKTLNAPEPYIPRVGGVYKDWLNACLTGQPACSNFEYSVPLTEMVILGTVALRAGRKIEWDDAAMKVTNAPEANRFLIREYRKGWNIPGAKKLNPGR